MTCSETTISLGVYLLGALEPADRAAVDAHLEHCAECRQQLAELAALPSLLERLELADFEPTLASDDAGLEGLTPSEDLYSRVAAQVRDEEAVVRRVRFGRFQKITAAAAAVVVVAGVGIGIAVHQHGSNGTNPANLTVSHKQGPIDMRVQVVDQTSSSTLHVTVSGVPSDEHCRLIAVGTDGSRELAGQWDATYSGWADFTGSTRFSLSNLSRLVLLGSNGRALDSVAV